MQGNYPIFLLAFAVLVLGATIAISNRRRPNGLAHNFGLIVMVNGALMFGGLCIFALLSAFLAIVSIP